MSARPSRHGAAGSATHSPGPDVEPAGRRPGGGPRIQREDVGRGGHPGAAVRADVGVPGRPAARDAPRAPGELAGGRQPAVGADQRRGGQVDAPRDVPGQRVDRLGLAAVARRPPARRAAARRRGQAAAPRRRAPACRPGAPRSRPGLRRGSARWSRGWPAAAQAGSRRRAPARSRWPAQRSIHQARAAPCRRRRRTRRPGCRADPGAAQRGLQRRRVGQRVPAAGAGRRRPARCRGRRRPRRAGGRPRSRRARAGRRAPAHVEQDRAGRWWSSIAMPAAGRSTAGEGGPDMRHRQVILADPASGRGSHADRPGWSGSMWVTRGH